ncbi:RfbB dTDP-D-glucose 4,6-dehydratase [Candidatus Planktophila vernalis]|uniref:dTDP-glucose 4,6-dehydratase n=1 Tax=Candidatus Planktophila vernalis TaxID=1884907 RepID=UPI003CF0711D
MRLLVTGGAGFIGSNYVRRILDGTLSGIESVVVLDKMTYAGIRSNLPSEISGVFQFIEGDICDQDLFKRLMAEADSVINFAAESHVDRSIKDPSIFIKTNVEGVNSMLQVIKSMPNKLFMQISTDEVYGSIENGSWVESEPLLPNSPYAASKASAELLVRSYTQTYGLDTRITRCSNNYGPNHYPEKLIPLFITNILRSKKLPLYGNGLNVRDWLHVDDHCQGIHKVLFSDKSGEVFNIGGGEELTNLEITKLILTEMDCGESLIESVEDRLGHDFRYSVDWTKIHTELGYEPKVKFVDGLKSTIHWYRDNPSWWEPLIKS